MSISKQRSNTSQISLKRGFQVNSNVCVDSPEQQNSQNVSVIVNNSVANTKSDNPVNTNKLTQDREIKLDDLNDINYPNLASEVNEIMQTPQVDKTQENIPEKVNILNINSNVNIEELLKLCKNKDCLIAALSVIVDIYQHNPLVVNKYIIPDEEMLKNLLFCLTSADDIIITKQNIVDTTCCSSSEHNFSAITKIMIKKDNQTFNFKYSYPNVIQFLDERNISWKMCC